MIRYFLTAAIIASLAFSVGPVLPGQPEGIGFTFEEGVGDWTLETENGATAELETLTVGSGRTVLRIQATFPGVVGLKLTPWRDWFTCDEIDFDLQMQFTKDGSQEVEPVVYFKDGEFRWYQALPCRDSDTDEVTTKLPSGKWQHFVLDISPASTQWAPEGHGKPWTGLAMRPREFGIRFHSNRPYTGSILIDDIVLSRNSDRRSKPTGDIELTLSGTRVPQYEKLEVTFDLGKTYSNPFDPAVVDVMAHFTAPDGSPIALPGFHYQAYERAQADNGREKLSPVGRPVWKVRFAPHQVGRYEFFVTASDGQTRKSRVHTFESTPPTAPRGPVRVSETDPHYFEFTNGEFYYPIGLNVRDGNVKQDHGGQRGTYDIDYYFGRMADAGMNFVRTWMSAWWLALEWGENYDASRYHGLGRYSMANAWRLDYTLELAEKLDLYVELTLNNHGQLRQDKFDFEWEYNPFWVANGGHLATPRQFWSDERARELTRQRYRYIVARWGYSTHLMTWDMWNEVDLSEGYTTQVNDPVVTWHREFADYLREIDPFDHIVTSHYCLGHLMQKTGGKELFIGANLDYIQADSYWGKTQMEDLNTAWTTAQGTSKPFVLLEFGRNPAWARYELPVGVWVSTCTPMAGTAMYWLWDQVDAHDMWGQYGAVRQFMEGEDHRGKNWQRTMAVVRPQPYAGQAMHTDTELRIYVYYVQPEYRKQGWDPTAVQTSEGVTVLTRIGTPGDYTVEFWDTEKGGMIETATVAANERGILTLTLPPIGLGMAIKVKAQSEG